MNLRNGALREGHLDPGLQVHGQGVLSVAAFAEWEEERGRTPRVLFHRRALQPRCETLAPRYVVVRLLVYRIQWWVSSLFSCFSFFFLVFYKHN